MAQEWNAAKLVEYLAAAGAKGRTRSDLEKKIPAGHRSKSASILRELRSEGLVAGPFKKRAEYFFAPQYAPTRTQAQEAIESLLRDAGAKLTTNSELSRQTAGFLQVFFPDALAALKSEARVVELRRGRSAFYVHRDAILEQLGLADDSGSEGLQQPRAALSHILTLEDVRPIYEKVKAEQGGIGTVKIYDIMARLGAAKNDLHRLLIDEAKRGRVSLHRASSAKFPREVIDAGIRLEGQPEPLVTIVLKE
jgi:hypothetical protein